MQFTKCPKIWAELYQGREVVSRTHEQQAKQYESKRLAKQYESKRSNKKRKSNDPEATNSNQISHAPEATNSNQISNAPLFIHGLPFFPNFTDEELKKKLGTCDVGTWACRKSKGVPGGIVFVVKLGDEDVQKYKKEELAKYKHTAELKVAEYLAEPVQSMPGKFLYNNNYYNINDIPKNFAYFKVPFTGQAQYLRPPTESTNNTDLITDWGDDDTDFSETYWADDPRRSIPYPDVVPTVSHTATTTISHPISNSIFSAIPQPSSNSILNTATIPQPTNNSISHRATTNPQSNLDYLGFDPVSHLAIPQPTSNSMSHRTTIPISHMATISQPTNNNSISYSATIPQATSNLISYNTHRATTISQPTSNLISYNTNLGNFPQAVLLNNFDPTLLPYPQQLQQQQQLQNPQHCKQ